MDIYCPKCGEPWDYPFDDALTPNEVQRFKRGEGCPACDFGTTCTWCFGTGKDTGYAQSCPTCGGRRYITIRRIPGHPKHGQWVYGWEPNVKSWTHGDPLTEDNPYFLRLSERYQCRDGWVTCVMVRCPDCLSTASPCPKCDGTGHLTPRQPDRAFLSGALLDLLGDDLDGVAAELDDAEFLGLI